MIQPHHHTLCQLTRNLRACVRDVVTHVTLVVEFRERHTAQLRVTEAVAFGKTADINTVVCYLDILSKRQKFVTSLNCTI